MKIKKRAKKVVIKRKRKRILANIETRIRETLAKICPSYTIFFTNESGDTVKMYSGIVIENRK